MQWVTVGHFKHWSKTFMQDILFQWYSPRYLEKQQRKKILLVMSWIVHHVMGEIFYMERNWYIWWWAHNSMLGREVWRQWLSTRTWHGLWQVSPQSLNVILLHLCKTQAQHFINMWIFCNMTWSLVNFKSNILRMACAPADISLFSQP